MNLVYRILFIGIIIMFCIVCIYIICSARSHAMHTRNGVATICCVAGKSGGHILPCLTLARKYKDNDPTMRIIFFSTDSSLDRTILADNPLIDLHIPLSVDRTQGSILSYPILLLTLMTAWCTSIYYVLFHKPTVIISSGGLVSLPVCIAGWLLRIPIEIHELNAVPGKATRFLARMATKIHTYFSKTADYFRSYTCILSSYPIRFTDTDKQITQQEAYAALHFNNQYKTLLIIGGSQGSLFINSIVNDFISHLDNPCINIIHQTGTADTHDWQELYKTKNISAHVFGYDIRMALYYAAADLIITRAGAGSLFEIAFFKKQSIIIPLETDINDHQVNNAYAIAEQLPHLFRVVRQAEYEHDVSRVHALIHTSLMQSQA